MSAPADDRATEADIRACFRLLLGRDPHPEEWPGHSSRAGEPLAAVVASYVNSMEFHRRRLQDPSAGAPPEIAELDGVRILAAPDDLAVGHHVLHGAYEPEVAALFRDTLRPGMHVLDIGANIGVFTLLAASLVGPHGSVLAVEPNPRNARMIEASRRMNGFAHVTVLQAAAGRATSMLEIRSSFSNGTALPIEDGAELTSETVPCVALDRFLDPGRTLGLIKADVEGAEYNALLGCRDAVRRDRPVIVFEFSPAALAAVSGVDAAALLEWLVDAGYGFEVLRPDGRPVAAGQDTGAVLAAAAARRRDHIDVVARPAPGRARWWHRRRR